MESNRRTSGKVACIDELLVGDVLGGEVAEEEEHGGVVVPWLGG